MAVRAQERSRNVQVGQLLEIRQQAAGQLERVEVVNPRGESERLALNHADSRKVWWYEGTSLSGLYEARFGSPINGSRWFAVNVDTRESDVTRSDITLLPDQIEVADGETEINSADFSASLGRPIYRYLLAGLLGLLLTESFYAFYVGRATG